MKTDAAKKLFVDGEMVGVGRIDRKQSGPVFHKRHRMSSFKFLVLILLIVFLIAGQPACNPKASKTITPIMVQLSWSHWAEFAGLYAADQNGYYAAERLAVTFIQGGSNVNNLASVLDGRALFGIASAEQLIAARAQGKKLTALAAVYRRSPTVFFTLARSGITRPQEFAGKTIRVTNTYIPTLHAMLGKFGITPDQYREVNLPSDIAMFASGEVPIWGAYSNGMPILVQRAGYSINIIYPDDYGIHFYGDVIFATEQTVSQQPDLALRFVHASLKGWTYAIENPALAGQLVSAYEPKADLALENLKMTATLPLVNTGVDQLGWMKPETWTGMEQTLRQQGVLTAPLDINQVYTMQFLEEIYK
jgi:NitT/TauT family transport system substrate-binding protein